MTLTILGFKLLVLILIGLGGAAIWEYAYMLQNHVRFHNLYLNLGLLFATLGTLLLFFAI